MAFNISIHALRMEGDNIAPPALLALGISIHALRMEGDRHRRGICPQRGAISIHALRMEGDPALSQQGR